MMTMKQRIKSVFLGEKPDVIPFMLDLSHWFYHRQQIPWDLSQTYRGPEYDLIDLHKEHGVGFYLPNLGHFYDVAYPDNVKANVRKSIDSKKITWSLETPMGKVERTRIWEDISYSWGIHDWGIVSKEQLKIFAFAMANRTYNFLPEKYQAWVNAIGDIGVCYVGTGYSAMGHLLNYWMGIEGTIYAAIDWPETVRKVVDEINQNNLKLIDMLAASPVEFVIMGDNFSGDIQPRHFFDQWSRDYYTEAVRRLHDAGKCIAVHIDGQLFDAIKMIKETGADCADAVTPVPLGDLTPQQCREEAGKDFILSGGVSPDLWLPDASINDFKKAVLDWVALKKQSFRLIANAGDQVPPGAEEERIDIMRDLVELHGKY
jgi:hypothetical protein